MTDASHFGAAPDSRAQAIKAAEQRAAERARLIARQTSSQTTPADRIQLWESLHALSLPRAATHPLLVVIAEQTALTLDQIRVEQHRRAEAVQS